MRPLPAAILTTFAASAWAIPLTVPSTHPYLLGSRASLQQLAQSRAGAYQRTESVARTQPADDHSKMISLSLVTAIEQDSALGRQAVALALNYIDGPIQIGHTTFGHDLALCAVVYDLCYEYWTPTERSKFIAYLNATVDSNVNSETHVFHDGWWGYKHWGIGLACLASYRENPRAAAIFDVTYNDYLSRAAPGLELAGDGGGWAEGYYVHYWSYEWLFFLRGGPDRRGPRPLRPGAKVLSIPRRRLPL